MTTGTELVAMAKRTEALALATARTLRALLSLQTDAHPDNGRLWPEKLDCHDLKDGLDEALAPYEAAELNAIHDFLINGHAESNPA